MNSYELKSIASLETHRSGLGRQHSANSICRGTARRVAPRIQVSEDSAKIALATRAGGIPEVVVDGDTMTLVRRRQTLDDLLKEEEEV